MVKRYGYKLNSSTGDIEFGETPNGDLVNYSDYLELKKELDKAHEMADEDLIYIRSLEESLEKANSY